MNRFVFHILVVISLLVSSGVSAAINVEFEGTAKEVIKDVPPNSTGLDAVYVVYDTGTLTAVKITGISSPATLKVMKYSNLGGGYAVDVPVSLNGSDATILSPEGDMGYIVDDGVIRYNFWIVNYEGREIEVSAITTTSEGDCDYTSLMMEGKGSAIHYYSVNGRQCVLDRDIKVEYATLEWDDSQEQYISVDKSATFEYLQPEMIIRPPFYCNTQVTVSGDRFMKIWGNGISVESNVLPANGVDVHTRAEQTNAPDSDQAANMIRGDETLLGGSAPADFVFYAYPTDAVIHNEWQIADDPEFEYTRYRFTEQNLSYTFDQEGRYYVRYVGSNADGSCVTYGETYEIGIGASDLRIPNAFSPDGDGVNDVWKVGYRSLTEFRCWIFDRNGRQMFYFDSPDQGWDGKHNGKTVAPGVYYYVIEAKGADGVKYKKGGDINILRYRKIGNSAQSVQ